MNPPQNNSQQAQQLLHSVFGYDSFRLQQGDIIAQLVNGGEALVLMPTGGGKSLCYQIPALIRDGVGIVVSPLIALMQDQVSALQQVGVRAAFLNSSLNADEVRQVESALRNGGEALVLMPTGGGKSLCYQIPARSEERRVGQECRSRWSPCH